MSRKYSITKVRRISCVSLSRKNILKRLIVALRLKILTMNNKLCIVMPVITQWIFVLAIKFQNKECIYNTIFKEFDPTKEEVELFKIRFPNMFYTIREDHLTIIKNNTNRTKEKLNIKQRKTKYDIIKSLSQCVRYNEYSKNQIVCLETGSRWSRIFYLLHF